MLLGTLKAVTAARSTGNTSTTLKSLKMRISGTLRSFAVAESYPDLKADTNFIRANGPAKSLRMIALIL